MTNTEFEEFIAKKNNEIDNAAYDLLCVLATIGDTGITEDDDGNTIPEWNMEMIDELVDAAKDILATHGVAYCHPFWSDETPCYMSDECKFRCKLSEENEG